MEHCLYAVGSWLHTAHSCINEPCCSWCTFNDVNNNNNNNRYPHIWIADFYVDWIIICHGPVALSLCKEGVPWDVFLECVLYKFKQQIQTMVHHKTTQEVEGAYPSSQSVLTPQSGGVWISQQQSGMMKSSRKKASDALSITIALSQTY